MMSYGEMMEFLEHAREDKAKLRVTLDDGETFIGYSDCLDEGDDDLGWSFDFVDGSGCIVPLKDITDLSRIEQQQAVTA